MGDHHADDGRATCKGLHTAACSGSCPAGLERVGEAEGVDANRLFQTQMIAHHEGAISVAQTEIEEGQSPPAVAMARSIVSTQQQEIDTMKGILASL